MLNQFSNAAKQNLKDEHEPEYVFYLISSARVRMAQRFFRLYFTIYVIAYCDYRQHNRMLTGT